MGKTQKRRGFTLVELLVVLLILGVLVGLAVPRYMKAQKNARFRTFTANVREIQSTLEVYRMDKTSTGPAEYPDNLSELQGYFTQQPVNPYTGKSMLSDNPEESGLQYTNNGSTYTLTVVQRDVDDVNKNGDTTEPLPVALNVGGETETPTVTEDTEPPIILAVTLTGTVDGKYGTYDVLQYHRLHNIPYTATINVNDIAGTVITVTATDNVGVTDIRIDLCIGHPCRFLLLSAQLTPSVTPGTWQYTFDSLAADQYVIFINPHDAAGYEPTYGFYLVVTE